MFTRFAQPDIELMPRDAWPDELRQPLPRAISQIPHALELRVTHLSTILHCVSNRDTNVEVRRWKVSAAVRIGNMKDAYVFQSSTRMVAGDVEDEVTSEFLNTVMDYVIRVLHSLDAEGVSLEGIE